MIPHRITMQGWMRYRDEQVADFSAGRLIAICGENGAGKSAIFDAITYALFGMHRLGKQNVDELISEDLDRLAVSFEFDADGRRYLVKRGHGHRARERDNGLWFWDEVSEDWTPAAGAEKKAGLQRAIDSLIRLSPEAFTASFMLQQGAVTAFLDAKPSDRFEIISSLIGLKEYEALESRARRAQQRESDAAKRLTAELETYADVSEDALAALSEALTAAEQRVKHTEQARDQARTLHADARRHATLVAECAELDQRIAAAEGLIAQRDQIEAAARRHAEVGQAIETVDRLRGELDAATAAEQLATRSQTAAAALDVATLDATLAAAEARVTAAVRAQRVADQALTTAVTAERAAADFARAAERILSHRGRIDQIDEALRRAEPALASLTEVAAELAETRVIAGALPALRELKRHRERHEALRGDDPERKLTHLVAARTVLDTDLQGLRQRITAQEKRREQARDLDAGARAHESMLVAQLKSREQSAGETVCARCGQPIDAERARRELDDLRQRLFEARSRSVAAKDALAGLETKLSELAGDLQEAEHARAENARDVAQCERLSDDLRRARIADQEALDRFTGSAPPALAAVVAGDAPSTALAALYNTHAGAPNRLRDLESRWQTLGEQKGKVAAWQEERARLAEEIATLAERLGVRHTEVPHAAELHAATEQALGRARAEAEAAAAERDAADAAVVVARTAAAEGKERRVALDAESARHTQEAAGHQRAARLMADALPAEMREPALSHPAALHTDLVAEHSQLDDAPERLRALTTALHDHGALSGERTAKLREIERIPAGHRIPETDAAAALAEAEAADRLARAGHHTARDDVNRMETRLEQAAQKTAALDRAATRAQRFAQLTKLLGKTGLQGALVLDALTTITNHANAFLQRLTGGSLRLILERQEGDALALRALDATCMHEPRSVEVLSGSQRFRCAVALASGIGQYAGAGGMRSIVIDEGFGSLDQTGQQLMIDELKQLAIHMDRVIVVSHLEAFTNRDHFPDQILVETAGNASHIRMSG